MGGAEHSAGRLIAAHDIGALGFFGRHDTMIDLAGLVSPQVVPFIRDEPRLAAYMDERPVEYLIAFHTGTRICSARHACIYYDRRALCCAAGCRK